VTSLKISVLELFMQARKQLENRSFTLDSRTDRVADADEVREALSVDFGNEDELLVCLESLSKKLHELHNRAIC
jgi:hypothetical protein